MLINKINLH